MNCSEIQDLAAALVDHEPLSIIESQEVEHHLDECPACRYEYEMDRIMSRIVRSRIGLVDTPKEAYRSVLHAIELG